MLEADALAFIGRHNWTFAKTMPENPHEYLVRDRVEQVEEGTFDAFILFIREQGEVRVFHRQKYLHWYAPDGWHYWTMGWPVQQTIIINRAEVDDTRPVMDADADLRWSSPDGQKPVMA